jgi:hypothetical protein
MSTFIRRMFQRSLLMLSLLSSAAFAQNIVIDEGTILQIDRSFINLSDAQYALMATTRVERLPGNRKARLQDLKPGDNVRVKLIKIAKKRYVDTIYLLTAKAQRNNNEEEGRRRP